ncbi:MAG: S1 RNA-binding domain-containing protein [Kouleothrix sp.]
MTDQERPDEERNELLDDLVSAATAVADTEDSKQQPAVEQQPESAEPAAVALAAEATQAVATPSAEAEGAAVEEVPVVGDEPTAVAATAGASATEVTGEVAEVPVADTASDASDAKADSETPVAEVESAVEAASETPATEATSDASAADAPAAEAEGASYTPVAEDESGKPRRVKDLEPGMELEGRVTSIALYGIFVDIGVGRDGLVHISEMSDTRIDSPSDVVQIGDTVKVRVKSVEPDGRRISLTMRSKERGNQPRERARKKPELNREALSELRVGDNIEGTVTGIAPFGVFVDIGVGKDGLVHVSELAEGRIEKAEDAVTVGQTYTFKVLEVDADGTRISLSLRRAQRGQRLAQLEKGQIVEGTISGLAPFGAFVDIGVGRDGLVHISELSDQRVAKVEDAVKVGDTVKVRVLDIDSGSKRISLSMRLEDRPREQPAPSEPREPREPREDRPRRDDRAPRGPRRERDEAPRAPEVYSSTEEPEESFSGDATIEDLLSKFGNVNKRDRKRRADEDEEDYEERYSRRQRDAIRRTLQQMSDDE